jgi:hypothetical protein
MSSRQTPRITSTWYTLPLWRATFLSPRRTETSVSASILLCKPTTERPDIQHDNAVRSLRTLTSLVYSLTRNLNSQNNINHQEEIEYGLTLFLRGSTLTGCEGTSNRITLGFRTLAPTRGQSPTEAATTASLPYPSYLN